MRRHSTTAFHSTFQCAFTQHRVFLLPSSSRAQALPDWGKFSLPSELRAHSKSEQCRRKVYLWFFLLSFLLILGRVKKKERKYENWLQLDIDCCWKWRKIVAFYLEIVVIKFVDAVYRRIDSIIAKKKCRGVAWVLGKTSKKKCVCVWI